MDSKNKLFKLGEVSYYYLPYGTDGKEQFLRIMQHDGKLYINLTNVDSLTPEKTFTCRIFSASSKDINDQSLLSLEVEADGVLRTVTLPINTDGLSMLSNIQSLVENKDISFEIIEDNYDCPKVDNFNIDPDLNPPPTGEKGDIKRDMRLKLGSRSGQELKKTEVVVDGKSLTGLGQEIDTEKLRLKTRQVVSLLDSKSYDDSDGTPNILKGALLTVSSQDNTKPVAVFAKEKRIVDGVETEVTTFKISTEFLSEFIEKNPSLSSFPHGTEVGEYTSYDVDQLKLSENLTIEDVQIKAASEQFAVMFSALGMQLVDKDKNLGKFANTENPFNIGVTTDFLSSALSNQPGLLIDKKGKGFDALLIAAIQQKRQIGNDKHGKANEPVSIKFDQAGIELYSLPIVLKDEEGKPVTEYLNIKKDLESGKSYIYMHSTNELPRSKTVPQFHEIDIIHLEESNDSTLNGARGTSLFIGFKSGKSANRANIEIDYTANQTTLKTIKTVLDSEFERTPVAGSEHSTAMFAGEKRKIGDEEYTIYSRPTESSSEILSLSDVAILKSTHIEDEDPDKPVEKSGFITDPPVIDPPTPPHDSPEPPHDPPEPPHDPPAAPHDPIPEEPDEELPEMKWKTDIGKPKAKPSSLKKWLIAFFALGTLLSMVVPILGIVSGILAGAIVVVDVKPWVVDAVKSFKDSATSKKPKVEKTKSKILELQKSKNKVAELQNNIVAYEEEKIRIQNDPSLSDSEKKIKIEKLNQQILAAKQSIESENKSQIIIRKQISVDELNDVIKQNKKILDYEDKEHKKHMKVQNKDLEKYKNEENALLTKRSNLENEKQEMEEYESLQDKITRGLSLSLEEQEKYEKLKKKFKKSKKTKSSDYDAEIESLSLKYEEAKKNREEKEDQISNIETVYQEKIKPTQETIRDAENEKDNLKTQIAKEKPLVKQDNTGDSISLDDFNLTPTEKELTELSDEERKYIETSGTEMDERLKSIKKHKRETGDSGRGK